MKTAEVRRGLVLALAVALSTIPAAGRALQPGGADCLDCHRMHLMPGVSTRNFADVARRYRLRANDQSAPSTATRRSERPASSLATPFIAPAAAPEGAATLSPM